MSEFFEEIQNESNAGKEEAERFKYGFGIAIQHVGMMTIAFNSVE
jgi:hypothetical protein